MQTFDLEAREVGERATRWWWLFLVTGLIWLLVSIIVLRFDYTTVAAVSILESAGHVLDQALVRAVARWRFEPATRNGIAVSTTLTVQHVFRR